MKKSIATTLATLVLGLAAVGAAQTADTAHELDVVIPEMLMIQIVDGAGAEVGSPFVMFDIDPADYLLVAEAATAQEFTPTGSNFADVRVLTNYATWSVALTSSALVFTPVVTGAPAAGLSLADITVDGAGDVELFALDTTADIVSGTSPTTGWESLGFGGDSFRLSLDGDEEPGTYSWSITYTLTAP